MSNKKSEFVLLQASGCAIFSSLHRNAHTTIETESEMIKKILIGAVIACFATAAFAQSKAGGSSSSGTSTSKSGSAGNSAGSSKPSGK